MRPLRRRVSPLFPPVAERPRRGSARPNPQETARLRDLERLLDDSNQVADYVIYRILSQREIGNFLKSQLYKEAIERFADRLPRHEIRALVDATLRKEADDRLQVERTRRAEAARKAQSGVAGKAMLLYRLRAAGLTA